MVLFHFILTLMDVSYKQMYVFTELLRISSNETIAAQQGSWLCGYLTLDLIPFCSPGVPRLVEPAGTFGILKQGATTKWLPQKVSHIHTQEKGGVEI